MSRWRDSGRGRERWRKEGGHPLLSLLCGMIPRGGVPEEAGRESEDSRTPSDSVPTWGKDRGADGGCGETTVPLSELLGPMLRREEGAGVSQQCACLSIPAMLSQQLGRPTGSSPVLWPPWISQPSSHCTVIRPAVRDPALGLLGELGSSYGREVGSLLAARALGATGGCPQTSEPSPGSPGSAPLPPRPDNSC